ncbi:MAG: NYN domain-containing protein [Deltaproteobacteria bacterium]|jgi:hypothetical protein|nr:NYN domain-containing protein [Deltaproteobacteria bacterium]
MQKLLVFQDTPNIEAGFGNFCRRLNIPQREFDHGLMLDYLSEGRNLMAAHCYVAVDPRNPAGKDQQINHLWSSGWMVHEKIGETGVDGHWRVFDVEMALDIANLSRSICPDIVTICSGDETLLPVVIHLRRNGIRVEVAAFECSTSKNMARKSSGFISLDIAVDQWFGSRPAVDNIGAAAGSPETELVEPELLQTADAPFRNTIEIVS